MADSFVQVPPDSTGKQVDAASLPVGGQTVQRQRVVLGDNVGTATYATILSAGPAGTEGGLVVRNIPSGTQTISGNVGVTGTVSLGAGTANIGTINNISATVAVSGAVSLAAGTNVIGTINNISATVVVSGAVSLAAGANNIGTINNISATVVVSGQVSLGPSTNNIGAVSLAAGTANIGFINNISATVLVAGSLTIGGTAGATSYTAASSFTMIGGSDGSFARGMLMDAAGHPIISGTVALAAGVNNIGFINGISATVNVAGSLTIGGTPGATSYTAGSSYTMIGGTDGSLARGILTDASGRIAVNVNSGAVSLAAGANNIGTINNISAAVVLAAGSANIGSINNISATVVVSGAVSLATGANKIGFLGKISAGVVLAAGTNNIGTIQAISAAVVCIGQFAGGVSATVGNTPVLIGGTDGSFARMALMDASGRQIVNVNTGQVSLAAGTANIGTINNISATVVVSGAVSLAAGANNIGTINNISATVVVSGAVSLAAGANNIGTINNISAGVVLAAGAANIGSINNISATVVVSGAVSLATGANNIGFIGKISAGVVLAAGAANIGTINNISANVAINNTMLVGLSSPALASNATQKAAWCDGYGRAVMILNHPSLYNTASHGPKVVICSTSAAVAMVAAPGAGLCIYITKIAATNSSATLTRGDVYGASATSSAVCGLHLAASGGGFIMDYNPPIKILSNTAVNCRVKPSVSEVWFNVHFYVGPK